MDMMVTSGLRTVSHIRKSSGDSKKHGGFQPSGK